MFFIFPYWAHPGQACLQHRPGSDRAISRAKTGTWLISRAFALGTAGQTPSTKRALGTNRAKNNVARDILLALVPKGLVPKGTLSLNAFALGPASLGTGRL